MFDVASDVENLKTMTRLIAKKRYRKSRLDRYTDELIALRGADCSASELRRWLRARRIVVDRTTVSRWLKKRGL